MIKFQKQYIPYIIAIASFVLFAVIYCLPALQGKTISTSDGLAWQGMANEVLEYYKNTGNASFWTNSMFSGMPTFQITGTGMPTNPWFHYLNGVVNLYFTGIMSFFITYLLGFFILLRAFKINMWMSIFGAMAITLSSYFIVILEAGHFSKASCLGCMGAVIGGFYLIYNQRRFWLGGIIVALFMTVGAMQHPQMTYYTFLLIGILFFAELWIHYKDKQLKYFSIATLIFIAAVLVGMGTRYTQYSMLQEYAQETMRGGHSELTKDDDANKTEGLDLDYATAWSYGVDETMTLLIPNYMGSSSSYNVGKNSNLYETLVKNGVSPRNAEDFCRNVPTYWGDQPFTAGTVYVGAIIVFLFMLGLMIVKGPYKWALLIATIFSILLSWGKNFMPLTDFFFTYFPMYSKFRAVSSILIVAEITMPLLGLLALNKVFKNEVPRKELLKRIRHAAYITGGICLLFAVFGGSMLRFTSPNDAQYFSQMPEWVSGAIVDERISMLRSDAFRSLIFIVLAAGCLWLFVDGKMKRKYSLLLMGVLIVVDLWVVDRRYINYDTFVKPSTEKNYFNKQPYEVQILQDKDPHFRVFNIATNTFNDSRTSYYLKSIGGYSAVKLRRYQDLIDRYLSRLNWKVIDMLNAKYIIVPNKEGNTPVAQLNPNAMGNAWFVDSVIVVNTPNEEIAALDKINLHTTAVIDAKFSSFLVDNTHRDNSASEVKLLSYLPNKLEYEINSEAGGTIVFSEIYYPEGWKSYIDGQQVGNFRANYALRALQVPSGQHRIMFEFHPDVIYNTLPVSFTFIFILYALTIGCAVYIILKVAGVKVKKLE